MRKSFNIHVADEDSHVTDFGKHNRLMVYGPTARAVGKDKFFVWVREDLMGLPSPTQAQILNAANGPQRIHPRGKRLDFVRSFSGTTDLGESVWYEYTWNP